MPTQDTLFATIERWQSPRPWGTVLDAGTGQHSLTWLCALPTTSLTAITAESSMMDRVRADPSAALRPCDELVLGNWTDPGLCAGRQFDTVLADYLLGSVDGHAPFTQEEVFPRLRRHVAPGGRLYVVGMQPLPRSASPPADVVAETANLRDACTLLAGDRCYREYPLSWVVKALGRAGFRVVDTRSFTILHSKETILRQLAIAEAKLPRIASRALTQGIAAHIAELRERIDAATSVATNGRIPASFDYVIVAEPIGEEAEGATAEPSAPTPCAGGVAAEAPPRPEPTAAPSGGAP